MHSCTMKQDGSAAHVTSFRSIKATITGLLITVLMAQSDYSFPLYQLIMGKKKLQYSIFNWSLNHEKSYYLYHLFLNFVLTIESVLWKKSFITTPFLFPSYFTIHLLVDPWLLIPTICSVIDKWVLLVIDRTLW